MGRHKKTISTKVFKTDHERVSRQARRAKDSIPETYAKVIKAGLPKVEKRNG